MCWSAAGILEWHNINVNGKMRVRVTKKVFGAVINKWPRKDWNNRRFSVQIQDDGPLAHSKKTVVKEIKCHLASLCNKQIPAPGEIDFIRQPAQSPDLNVNDLGVFGS